MELAGLSPIFEDNWGEATVGNVTFQLGARAKVGENPGITVIAFKRIVVQGKELKSHEFITETARALNAAGIGTNHYSNPAAALKAIRQIITFVARRALDLAHDTPLKHEHKGRIQVSPSLLKLG